MDIKKLSQIAEHYTGKYYLENPMLKESEPLVFKNSLFTYNSIGLIDIDCDFDHTCKSQFCLQLACALAANKEFSGLKPTREFKTLYISGKDPGEILHYQVQNTMRQLAQGNQDELYKMGKNIIAMPSILRKADGTKYTQIFPLFDVVNRKPKLSADKVRILQNYVQHFGIDILILDTFTESIGGEVVAADVFEDGKESLEDFAIRQLIKLATDMKIAIILVSDSFHRDFSDYAIKEARWEYKFILLYKQSNVFARFGMKAKDEVPSQYFCGSVYKGYRRLKDGLYRDYYFERTEGKQGYFDEIKTLPKDIEEKVAPDKTK